MGIVARYLFIALMLGAVISPALAKLPVTKGNELDTVPARSGLDGLSLDRGVQNLTPIHHPTLKIDSVAWGSVPPPSITSV